jgi:flavin reductase (DIM6/NTAB) family NADH-FMN oxidoreductase RutF
MFYETAKRDHGLPHDPFKAIVAPRPIGWISSVSVGGDVNLAPYSFFNAVSSRPDLVVFSSAGWKDSIDNIRQTGEFVANHAGEHLDQSMNMTSAAAPSETNEFALAGLEMAPCNLVKAPRVAAAYAALECRLVEIIELKDAAGNPANHHMAIGEVVGVHIDDRAIVDGIFDVRVARPITRMGYRDYARLGEVFQMTRPVWDGVDAEAVRTT